MFIHKATNTLREHKQKLTSTRLWLLEHLAQQSSPMNPYAIHEQHPHAKINVSTIYRNLELFLSLGLVHYVQALGGYVACHHEHDCLEHDLIICSQCTKIIETHIDDNTKKTL
mgnify:CR=1 FL=1